MFVCVELGLAAPITDGERQQNGAAVVGGQLHPAEGEQELEAEVGPRSGQPHGNGPARDVGLARQGGQVGAADLVTHEEVPVGGIQLAERRGHRVALLLVQRRLGGVVGSLVVEQPMEVPTAHGLPSEVRDQQVAGSDDGVRPLGVW